MQLRFPQSGFDFAGDVTCYVDDGYLCYEYNFFIIARTKIRCATELPPGPTTIVVETNYAEQRPPDRST